MIVGAGVAGDVLTLFAHVANICNKRQAADRAEAILRTRGGWLP